MSASVARSRFEGAGRSVRWFAGLAWLAATTATAVACPDYDARPAFGTVSLVSGFIPDPYIKDVTVGGTANLINCGYTLWQGWVASAPDLSINYQAGGRPLTFIVDSSIDSILLINGPDGTYVYDDDSGYRMGGAISFSRPLSGRYDVWIGAYNQQRGVPGRLLVTEQAP